VLPTGYKKNNKIHIFGSVQKEFHYSYDYNLNIIKEEIQLGIWESSDS